MTLGVSAIAAITSSVKSRGCGEVKRTRSRPVDLPARPQQFAERRPVAEPGPVGVDVLPKQRDLENAVRHERPDLGEHVAGAAVLLPAAQARHDAERAGVVAADGDGDPRGVRRLAARGQHRREPLQRLDDLDLRLLVRPGPAGAGPGSDPMLCVPNTTSTHGARSAMPARSFWARQPPTAICMPGCAVFTGSNWPRFPYSRLSAFSRTAQVLKTTTSGTLSPSARRYPDSSSRPARRSESWKFIWHPKVRIW